MVHKTLAAALLCGAVGFALPSYAAGYGSGTADTSSSAGTAATTAEKNSTNAANTSTPAKETKRAVRRIAARAPADNEHNTIEALNQKSLEAAQSGQTPDYAAVEPASNQQAQTARANSKTVVRRRTNNKASSKKGA
jgi:cell fate (sporulation/competence/biofilm development) regulator YlbF (YheA/YmcA/DUF963 family)